jgi:hypothetical protein
MGRKRAGAYKVEKRRKEISKKKKKEEKMARRLAAKDDDDQSDGQDIEIPEGLGLMPDETEP